MKANEQHERESATEIVPLETPYTESATLLADEDPVATIVRLEKIAELAPRYEQAMRTILLTCTFPGDWEQFGQGDKAKVCLSSAGAERLLKHFPIKFFEVQSNKEEWADRDGPAYRYTFSGKASMGERLIYAQGTYSTRDKFLGFAKDQWRAIEEINEGHIRNAAYHIFTGNAIKALLGLRALPVNEYQQLMNRTGQDARRTTGHTYGKGTKGGTSQEDKHKQAELAHLCIQIADAGKTVTKQNGKYVVVDQDADVQGITDSIEIAKAICETISSFTGKDGTEVTGLPASKLKNQRLEISLKTAQILAKGLSNANS